MGLLLVRGKSRKNNQKINIKNHVKQEQQFELSKTANN